MAIEVLKTPVGAGGGPDAGMFNLPPAFDTQRYAAEWVESSQVEMKRQRQVIQQAGMTADGWEVWKENENSEPTKVHASGNKVFILMCRPAKIQKEVNAIYGNVSKQILAREIKGETVTGEALQDPGILTEERLRRELGGDMQSGGGDVQPNRVDSEKAWENVTAAQDT